MHSRSSCSLLSRNLLHLLLAALAIDAAACAAPAGDPERVNAVSQPVIDGTPDTAHPEAILMRYETSASRCSGALIAPNLYLTARHCTAVFTGNRSLCAADGTTAGSVNLYEYSGDLDPKTFAFAASPTGPTLAHGKKVHSDGALSSCGHDLVLIELDTSIAVAPAHVRRTPVTPGEPLTLVGWGWTDRAATINATQRMTGRTTVLGVGPTLQKFRPLGDAQRPEEVVFAAAGEIAVAGLSAAGDSGGPAYDQHGEIAATVARGYVDPLVGPASYTTTAAHLALIDSALASAAASRPSDSPPMPDGLVDGGDGGGAPRSDAPGSDDDVDAPAKKKATRASQAAAPATVGGCSATKAPHDGRTTTWVLVGMAALVAAMRHRRTSMR